MVFKYDAGGWIQHLNIRWLALSFQKNPGRACTMLHLSRLFAPTMSEHRWLSIHEGTTPSREPTTEGTTSTHVVFSTHFVGPTSGGEALWGEGSSPWTVETGTTAAELIEPNVLQVRVRRWRRLRSDRHDSGLARSACQCLGSVRSESWPQDKAFPSNDVRREWDGSGG